MKTIIAIGDGMADNPVSALGGKTPLQAAKTPTMDKLAAQGELGLVRTIPPQIPPGSDTAFLSILGYNPTTFFSGRAPLEAAGSGITLSEGDVAYRCNLVAFEDCDAPLCEKRILSHSGGSVDEESAEALMKTLLSNEAFCALAEKNQMVIHPAPSFRQMAVQQGADIAALCTIPPHDHLGETAGGLFPSGCPVAEGLCEMITLAHEILNEHPANQKRREKGELPANGIWFWAEGVTLTLPNFEKTHGVKGFAVSAVPLVHGIARLAGLDSHYVEGATGELDTNYEGKAKAVLSGLAQGYDFALLHVEAPDECTHNGDTEGKIEAIEAFDGRVLAPLLAGLEKSGEDFRLLVLSDHKTLTATRGHDADPVPYILYTKQDAQNAPGGRPYCENSAASGPFLEEGHRLIGRLFEKS